MNQFATVTDYYGGGDVISTLPTSYKKSNKEDLFLSYLKKEETNPILPLYKKRTDRVELFLTNNHTVLIHNKLTDLIQEIKSSKTILNLKENWDTLGSMGYNKKTYYQAIDFIANFSTWLMEEFIITIPTPKILPSIDGCIDLYWKKENYDLIIKIPAFPDTQASFYGDDNNKTEIGGKFPLGNFKQGCFLCLFHS